MSDSSPPLPASPAPPTQPDADAAIRQVAQAACDAAAQFSGNVALMVGEQHFYTRRETLCRESVFFRRLFVDAHAHRNSPAANRLQHHRWRKGTLATAADANHNDDAEGDDDGFFFVDADPQLFAHVLRYLRHGIFPVLLCGGGGGDGAGAGSSSHGHHSLPAYAALAGLAAQLGIAALETWLREGRYRDAVQTGFARRSLGDSREPPPLPVTGRGAVVQQREFHHVPRMREMYRCPRGVVGHSAPTMCDAWCDAAAVLAGKDGWEREEVVDVEVVEKWQSINLGVCLKDWTE